MKQSMLVAAAMILLLVALLALPAMSAPEGSPLGLTGIVHADGDEPTPTPTATPEPLNGSCQSSSQCGN